MNNSIVTFNWASLAEGLYFWNAIANDGTDNASSETYFFTIDMTAPSVSNAQVNSISVIQNDFICINATATDSSGIDKVWAYITYPNATQSNVTMSDIGSCAGSSGDNIFGIEINVGSTVGNLTIHTSYANDTLRNLGYQNPWPALNVTVMTSPPHCPSSCSRNQSY